jgi:ferritin
MLSEKLATALNDQIKHELYSSYLYLAMAAHCTAVNLTGAARWLHMQSDEERGHAMKFYAYLNDRGVRVVLQAIDQPPAEYDGLGALFEQVLAHEQKVTGLIHDLYALALKEADYPTQVMLQWFINEQVEEEKNAQAIVDQIQMIGDQGAPLFMLDRQLGARAG